MICWFVLKLSFLKHYTSSLHLRTQITLSPLECLWQVKTLLSLVSKTRININQVILNGTQKSLFSCLQDVSQPEKNKTLNLLFFENTFSSVSATSDLNIDLDRNIHAIAIHCIDFFREKSRHDICPKFYATRYSGYRHIDHSVQSNHSDNPNWLRIYQDDNYIIRINYLV